jgi:hypothetical protein
MANVVQVVRKPGVDAEINLSNGTATLTYIVQLDSITTNPFIAANATTSSFGSVPAFGSLLGPYVLTSKRPKQISNKEKLWDVDCIYTLPQPGEEPKPSDAEIERWAVNIRMASIPYDIEVDRDKDDKQIVNSAGKPVAGITRPKSDEEITIDFSCETIDWTGIVACKDTVNSTSFNMTFNGQTITFSARTIFFKGYELAYRMDPSGDTYPRMTYRLMYRAETWDKKITNKGCDYLSGGVVRPIVGSTGEQDTAPRYLDANGGTLGIGATTTYTAYRVLPETDIGTTLCWDLGS